MTLKHQLFTSNDARKIFLEPTAAWQTVAGNSRSHQHGINHLFFYDEEAKEFFEAYHEDDKTEQLDALGDMLFVAWGITYHLNLSEPMAASQMSILYVLDKMQLTNPFATSQAVFEEVVRSNFSKFCKNQAEAEATVKHYDEQLGVNVIYDQVDDFFVIRSHQDQTGSDGKEYRQNKILKSIHFSEPDFSHIQS